ncbi:MAG: radical SAM protein [Deltaproteobacteria bacterium]|nr:MAG: radical SAM protein [Deltaproteobacteria bacterium]
MRYQGKIYRPPSEARSYILQATVGCSWNNCTYCDMYRDKPRFSLRTIQDCLEDLSMAAEQLGPRFEKVFIADGDALCMPMDHWESILGAIAELMPWVRQVSCYAMARNVLDKSAEELQQLRRLGLKLLYMGPESGDELTLRALAKGPRPLDSQGRPVPRTQDYLVQSHIDAAHRARAAGLALSAIFLLGAGGTERSIEHAEGSAALITGMDPDYLAALTLTLIPGTPLDRTRERRGFQLPDLYGLLRELRILVDEARPTRALFRTNHASNYLPLAGSLPRDRARIVATIDAALAGRIPLRPEALRGL